MGNKHITEKDMLQKTADKDIWLVDAGARGSGRLIGRITKSGARSFYYRYTTSKGERDRLPIGPFDSKGDGLASFTVQQARDQARAWSVMYRDGVKDLREHFAQKDLDAKQAARDAKEEADRQRQLIAEAAARDISVRQLFERWCATELQPMARADGKRTGRKDGGAYVRAQFERHVFPHVGDTLARELKKADVLKIIDAQKDKQQLRTASVLLSDLIQMMNFALDRELIDANPLATIKKARVVGYNVERDRVLSEEEIRLLAQCIPSSGLNQRSQLAIKLLLATGARIGELMGAVWEDSLPPTKKTAAAYKAHLKKLSEENGVKLGLVNLKEKTWFLEDTKNQRPHTIHLSNFAVRQFEELMQFRTVLADQSGISPWVFPAQDNSRPVCVKSFGKQLADRQRANGRSLSGRSKKTDSLILLNGRWTAHDLRRTAGTLMASLGISGDVIDEALNHVIESRVRRTYIQDRRLQEQAKAFDALGDKLTHLMGEKV